MTRTNWVLAALLVVALVLAYLSWTEKTTTASAKEIAVLALEPESISSIRYTHDRTTVEIAAISDALGTFHAVTVTENPPPAPATPAPAEGADGGTTETAPPPEPADPEVKSFTGGRTAARVVEQLAELSAYRSLGDIDAERRETLGLVPPEGTVEITRGTRRHVFTVGGKKFGATRRYLAPEAGSPVYLVEAMPFRNMESPDQLMERELVGLTRADAAAVTVAVGERERRLVQQNRADRQAAYWAYAESPDAKSDLADNWLDKVFRLRVEDYPGAEPEGAEPVCTVIFEEEKGPPSEVALLRAPGKDGDADWYARSSRLRATVKLRRHTASEVAADLEAVLGG